MSGPTHSNRNYKVMKGYSLPEGEYIIEEWNASNWDKETKERSSVPGAKDIKIYKKDPTKDYNKGDLVACLLYTSPSPRDLSTSRMPSSA